MNDTDDKRLNDEAREMCLASLCNLAKENGLTVQNVGAEKDENTTNASFAINSQVGVGMSIRAGWVIMGMNGYISSFPHGEDYHAMLRRKSNGPKGWEDFISKGACLAYVNFHAGKGLSADNFVPSEASDVEAMFKDLEINNESCEWGRKELPK